jgi:cholesterol oxidase
MLGVVTNPVETPADRSLRGVAEEIGVGSSYRPTPVGVLFGKPGTPPGTALPDPYFGGVGPARSTCTLCGQCMVGCRDNAKNTLVKNYLYLAEKAGAEVHPLTTVRRVRPIGSGPSAGYAIETTRTGKPGRKHRRTFTAEQVVFAAASLGTQRLLHKMKDEGTLRRLSDRLGELSRTNSEVIIGVRHRGRETDFSQGVAISSSIHPDEVTHIEPCRYGPGSNLLSLITAPLVDGGQRVPRWLRAFPELLKLLPDLKTIGLPRRWSQETIVLLVMQTLDNSVTTYLKRGVLGRRMTTKQGRGEPNPTWIPIAHEVARRMGRRDNAVPAGSVTDLIERPITAHFIGGCPIGDSPATGVVDPYQRLYGYPGLHVLDGAAVAANLGVNPSLTITAQAERALSLWPNHGEPDLRPALGEEYRRLEPVPPRSPVVPASAPGALRLRLTTTPPATPPVTPPAAGVR